MNENETAALVIAFDRAYINGKFVTPHGTQVVDLVNPTNNTVIGKVTMADEIDTRQAIAAAKEAFHTFRKEARNTAWTACNGCTTPWPSEWINSSTRRFWNTALCKTARRARTTWRLTFDPGREPLARPSRRSPCG